MEAWSAGCEFWVTADPGSSKWTRKIDWYLNFQIMKANRHQPSPLAPELKNIAADSDTELESVAMLEAVSYAELPLLIACENLLPTSTVISVPYGGKTDEWAKKCLKIWQDLNRPRMRVFLPEGAESDMFLKLWHKDSAELLDLIPS